MTILSTNVLFRFIMENHYLFAFAMLYYLASDFSIFQIRFTYSEIIIIIHSEDFVYLQNRTSLSVEKLYSDGIALSNLILLAA